eukprot:4055131-Amphidinium_carterae.1
MQIRFIVANVQSALLGLPDMGENNVSVHTGKHSYLEKNGKFEQLHRHGALLHAAAIILPNLHKPTSRSTLQSTRGMTPTSRQQSMLSSLVKLRTSANKRQFLNSFESRHSLRSKNRNNIALHTRDTGLGAQSVRKPKDNPFTIGKALSRNNP